MFKRSYAIYIQCLANDSQPYRRFFLCITQNQTSLSICVAPLVLPVKKVFFQITVFSPSRNISGTPFQKSSFQISHYRIPSLSYRHFYYFCVCCIGCHKNILCTNTSPFISCVFYCLCVFHVLHVLSPSFS